MLYISDVIRKVMVDRGVTVTRLASKMGLLVPSLSRKLQNKKEDYKISLLKDILAALDCSVQINIIDRESGVTLYTISDSDSTLL